MTDLLPTAHVGTSGDGSGTSYADHPFLAYAHIIPGVFYLLFAPFQLSRTLRRRRLDLHRQLGRILVGAGLVTGAFAIGFGLLYPYGGFSEASASAVFGVYFVVALVLAYRSVKRGDVATHRRWMIRAVAIGTGVGTIRALVGLSEGLGIASFENAFGPTFWIAFVLHASAAEVWLNFRPRP